jgi:hypothetical protein
MTKSQIGKIQLMRVASGARAALLDENHASKTPKQQQKSLGGKN